MQTGMSVVSLHFDDLCCQHPGVHQVQSHRSLIWAKDKGEIKDQTLERVEKLRVQATGAPV